MFLVLALLKLRASNPVNVWHDKLDLLSKLMIPY